MEELGDVPLNCTLCNLTFDSKTERFKHAFSAEHTAKEREFAAAASELIKMKEIKIKAAPIKQEADTKPDPGRRGADGQLAPLTWDQIAVGTYKMAEDQVYCLVCNTFCSSSNTFLQHAAGKQHASRLAGQDFDPDKRGGRHTHNIPHVEGGEDDQNVLNSAICEVCLQKVSSKDAEKHVATKTHETRQLNADAFAAAEIKCPGCVVLCPTEKQLFHHFATIGHVIRVRALQNFLKIHDSATPQQDFITSKLAEVEATQKHLSANIGKFEVILPEAMAEIAEMERLDAPETRADRHCDICNRDFRRLTDYHWKLHETSPYHVKQVNIVEMIKLYPRYCAACSRSVPNENEWSQHINSTKHVAAVRSDFADEPEAKRPRQDLHPQQLPKAPNGGYSAGYGHNNNADYGSYGAYQSAPRGRGNRGGQSSDRGGRGRGGRGNFGSQGGGGIPNNYGGRGGGRGGRGAGRGNNYEDSNSRPQGLQPHYITSTTYTSEPVPQYKGGSQYNAAESYEEDFLSKQATSFSARGGGRGGETSRGYMGKNPRGGAGVSSGYLGKNPREGTGYLGKNPREGTGYLGKNPREGTGYLGNNPREGTGGGRGGGGGSRGGGFAPRGGGNGGGQSFGCSICGISTTDQRGLDQHLIGQKHKLKAAKSAR